ncbi:MAG: DUF4097 family beta strand repeat-containing protein [Gemmatimonadaceae bacterium]
MSLTFRVPALLLVVLPFCASAQTLVGRSEAVYNWKGAVPAKALLTVKNFNGPIDVRPAEGTQASMRAEKHTERGGSVEDVAFEIQQGSGGDVVICATYRRNNPCDDRRGWSRDDDDDRWGRSVTVSMTVYVPKGVEVKIATGNGAVSVERVGDVQASTGNGRVRVENTDGVVRVSTGNGDVEVRSARAQVRVSTGNGRVSVSTTEGPVEARTGNGDIDVVMSKLRATDDMTFSTGSGAVRITLPTGYNGDLEATTGNGEIQSDFDLKVEGRMNPRHIRATIGSGGPRLRLSTGNGRLELRRGS